MKEVSGVRVPSRPPSLQFIFSSYLRLCLSVVAIDFLLYVCYHNRVKREALFLSTTKSSLEGFKLFYEEISATAKSMSRLRRARALVSTK